MKKRAFTLTEVLVTLGIIGVVAALTIPTLIKNHQRQVHVIQLKKVYSELSQALKESMVKKRALTLNEARTFDSGAESFFNTYFAKSKICSGSAGCLADNYKKLDGSPSTVELNSSSGFKCATLADGAVVCISNPPSI